MGAKLVAHDLQTGLSCAAMALGTQSEALAWSRSRRVPGAGGRCGAGSRIVRHPQARAQAVKGAPPRLQPPRTPQERLMGSLVSHPAKTTGLNWFLDCSPPGCSGGCWASGLEARALHAPLARHAAALGFRVRHRHRSLCRREQGWDQARDHARSAVETDNRLRRWLPAAGAPGPPAGLLYRCTLGNIDLTTPLGEHQCHRAV